MVSMSGQTSKEYKTIYVNIEEVCFLLIIAVRNVILCVAEVL